MPPPLSDKCCSHGKVECFNRSRTSAALLRWLVDILHVSYCRERCCCCRCCSAAPFSALDKPWLWTVVYTVVQKAFLCGPSRLGLYLAILPSLPSSHAVLPALFVPVCRAGSAKSSQASRVARGISSSWSRRTDAIENTTGPSGHANLHPLPYLTSRPH